MTGNVWPLNVPRFFFRLGRSWDATSFEVRLQRLLFGVEDASRDYTRRGWLASSTPGRPMVTFRLHYLEIFLCYLHEAIKFGPGDNRAHRV